MTKKGKPGDRVAPAPPRQDPSEPGSDVPGHIPRELLQAWLQFIRDDVNLAVNSLNNRLMAIRSAAEAIDATRLSLDGQHEIDNIAREIERAAAITGRLTHRVDSMAPEGAPALLKRHTAEPSMRAHILVVEDDDGNRAAIARLFQRLGHLVTPVRNGMEAWEALELGPVDCIVCDLLMPGLGGRSLYQQIEEQYPTLLRRFVFVTGDYTNPESRRFLDQSGCPVIAKPYEVSDLLSAVSGVLEKRE